MRLLEIERQALEIRVIAQFSVKEVREVIKVRRGGEQQRGGGGREMTA